MSNDQPPNSPDTLEQKIVKLENSVGKLIKYCESLKDENGSIKESNQQLMVERSELQTKNDKVRGQVEAMVDRLKAMDKTS